MDTGSEMQGTAGVQDIDMMPMTFERTPFGMRGYLKIVLAVVLTAAGWSLDNGYLVMLLTAAGGGVFGLLLRDEVLTATGRLRRGRYVQHVAVIRKEAPRGEYQETIVTDGAAAYALNALVRKENWGSYTMRTATGYFKPADERTLGEVRREAGLTLLPDTEFRFGEMMMAHRRGKHTRLDRKGRTMVQ